MLEVRGGQGSSRQEAVRGEDAEQGEGAVSLG